MAFFAVDGQGDPNTAPAYAEAMELLHSLSFTVKMSKMGGEEPEGYFEYVVPPLEDLWWTADPAFAGKAPADKNAFFWTSMIRQPDFVTEDVLLWAVERLAKKKPELDLSGARYGGVIPRLKHRNHTIRFKLFGSCRKTWHILEAARYAAAHKGRV